MAKEERAGGREKVGSVYRAEKATGSNLLTPPRLQPHKDTDTSTAATF